MAICKFGVVRSNGGKAEVTIFWPGGGSRIIYFDKGAPASFDRSQADGDVRMSANSKADPFLITIGGKSSPAANVSVTMFDNCRHSGQSRHRLFSRWAACTSHEA